MDDDIESINSNLEGKIIKEEDHTKKNIKGTDNLE